jgi:hypothetical protein
MTLTRNTIRVWLSALPLALSLAAGCAAPFEGMEKEVKPADLEALKANGAKANGLVVWTSSRDGLPHIFSMRTDGSDVKQLTKGETTDWHPRISPDGRKVLFMRSRDEGFVREAEANTPGTWDLYTVDAGGGALTKVVDNASWGSWAGPDEIVFMRGSKILRTKIGAEGETKIMDTSRYPFLANALVQQPEVSHDGHFVALTLGGARRQAGIWNIKKHTWTQMGQGGEIGWAPDGASVYWWTIAGKEQSRIDHEPVVAGIPADEHDPDKLVLVDLPGKRSRERFPRMSNDGKWVVFGAAIGTLENDLEDYELFLWEAGSSPTTATRLTFHSANDSWPDIFVGEPGKAAPPEAPTNGAEEKPAKPAEKAAEDEGAKETAPAAAAAEEPEESAAPPPPAKSSKKKKRR